MNKANNKNLSPETREDLLKVLQTRFEKYMGRHENLAWTDVRARLEETPEKLWSLDQMETTGGEPDVVGFDQKSDEFIFFDCSPESPEGRRSLCYDDEALAARKTNKPSGSAVGKAESMGIEILSEEQYRQLQDLGSFDLKTSSWIKTPPEIRALDGALFCDRRYDHVFVYHNGAQSYYGARGFRGSLKV